MVIIRLLVGYQLMVVLQTRKSVPDIMFCSFATKEYFRMNPLILNKRRLLIGMLAIGIVVWFVLPMLHVNLPIPILIGGWIILLAASALLTFENKYRSNKR